MGKTAIEQLNSIPPWDWPEDTRDRVLAVLERRGEASDERLAAIEMAGSLVLMNEAVARKLMALVSDADEPVSVRERVAISLGPVLESCDEALFDDPFEDSAVSEETFRAARRTLRRTFRDTDVPMDVRRRCLEAAVRAPRKWQVAAIREAWAQDDPRWKLTAVFCMQYVRGFESEILDALHSEDPEIHVEAVNAAGARGLKGAWNHVVSLVQSPATEKSLLLAAIAAVGNIRPRRAASVLNDLLDSDDEEIVEAVEEALVMEE